MCGPPAGAPSGAGVAGLGPVFLSGPGARSPPCRDRGSPSGLRDMGGGRAPWGSGPRLSLGLCFLICKMGGSPHLFSGPLPSCSDTKCQAGQMTQPHHRAAPSWQSISRGPGDLPLQEPDRKSQTPGLALSSHHSLLPAVNSGLSPALFPGTEAGATGSWRAHRGPQLGDMVPGAPPPGKDQGPLSSTCPPTAVRDARACLPGPPAAPCGPRHGGPLPAAPSGASGRKPRGGGLAHSR